MELSKRYLHNVKEGWGFFIGLSIPCMMMVYATQEMLPTLFQSIDSELIGLPVAFLLIAELVTLFAASGFVLTFLYTCMQQLILTKWHEQPKPFLLNTLAYRLFYERASRINVLAFGLFIGMYLQGSAVLTITSQTSDWVIVALLIGALLQGILLQFFAQCLLISLHYVGAHLLRSKLYRHIQPRKIKTHFLHLKRQALQPIPLILSFVVVPAVLLLFLFVAYFFGVAYSFNEMTVMVIMFSAIVYTEVTLILHFSSLHKNKQKPKA